MAQSALIELHYLPCVAYFSLLSRYQEVHIEQQEHYQKRSYRNRTHIAGANGLLRLSIPLSKGKNEQMPIEEVTISYEENWQHQHWESIRSAYRNAPFFDFYAEELAPFYQEEYTYLFEFNKAILETLLNLLQLPTQLHYTQSFQKQTQTHLDDFRNQITPKNKTSFNLSPYPQVFTEKHGFLPNLSILDLIFCTGPQTVLLLEGEMRE